MDTRKIIGAFLLLTGILSCSKNSGQEASPGPVLLSRVEAAFCDPQASGPETKNEVADFYYSVVWRTGDEIALVNVTQNRIDRYVYAGTDGGKENLFDASDGPYSYNPSDEVYAVYPYDAVTLSGGALQVHLTDNATFTSQSNNDAFRKNDIQVSAKLDPAALAAEGSLIPLQRVVTLLTVYSIMNDGGFTGRTVSDLSIQVAGCAGTAKIKFNGDGQPYVEPNGGDASSLTVALANAPKLGNPTNPAASFIPLYPCSLAEGITLRFGTTGGTCTVGAYRIPTITLGQNRYRNFTFYESGYTRVASQEAAISHGDLSWWAELDEASSITVGAGEGGWYDGSEHAINP